LHPKTHGDQVLQRSLHCTGIHVPHEHALLGELSLFLSQPSHLCISLSFLRSYRLRNDQCSWSKQRQRQGLNNNSRQVQGEQCDSWNVQHQIHAYIALA
jgi:hypothetical protein